MWMPARDLGPVDYMDYLYLVGSTTVALSDGERDGQCARRIAAADSHWLQ